MILIIEKIPDKIGICQKTTEESASSEIDAFVLDPAVYGPLTPDSFDLLWVPDFLDVGDVDPRLSMTAEERVELVRQTINHIGKNTEYERGSDFIHKEPQTGAQWSQAWNATKQIAQQYDGIGDWPTFPTFPDGKHHW
jgi:hypothetical protein